MTMLPITTSAFWRYCGSWCILPDHWKDWAIKLGVQEMDRKAGRKVGLKATSDCLTESKNNRKFVI